MTNATKIKIGTIADVAGVFVRPTDEAVVLIFGFHETKLVFSFGSGNDFCDLAFLVFFCVIAFGTSQSNDARKVWMFVLAVRAF